jgi:hypothetical protein
MITQKEILLIQRKVKEMICNENSKCNLEHYHALIRTRDGFKQEFFRRTVLPGGYNMLPFIRKGWGSLVDCLDDINLIRFYQNCIKGNCCISEFDSPNKLIVKMLIPDDIICWKGRSYELITYNYFYYKPHDLQHVFEPYGRLPCEAVSLRDAGITQDQMNRLVL